MKKILFGLLLTCSFIAKAQVYNNEWIDYSKTYYKFKIGKDGPARISQALLGGAGLGTTVAEYFQLWRNGVQVPIYTSVATGILPAGGYIEFWGQMNDGKPDRQLYRNPAYQMDDKWSLSTDTSTYFLTVNPNIAENLRLENAPNNVSGTTLPVEPYFIYTASRHFKDRINNGKAVNVGTDMFSSSYDKGEGWSSANITTTTDTSHITYGTLTSALNNLYVYNGGPAPLFKIALSGNANYERRCKVTINGDSVLGNKTFIEYNSLVDSAFFSLTTLSSNNATVTVTDIADIDCFPTSCETDRVVINKYEITYPRLFDFGGANNFEFILPPSTAGNYLQISNFAYGSSAPVLYDLSNGKRYTADLSVAPLLKFVLLPSEVTRNLVLVSEELSNISFVSAIESRNFINYSTSANAGDYLIISNPILFNGQGGTNPVEDYRAYRSSVAGGSFNAKIYLADDLIDQFAFGIKKHPVGIRNFIRYARQAFPAEPQFVFLIGKGVQYVTQKALENSSSLADQADLAKLNLVPTFGYPASDVLLSAEPGSSLSATPIGRLSVISPDEISIYLNKVKEYELIQATPSSTADKKWMKNVVHIVGASEEKLGNILAQAMDGFKKTITDTLYGAKVSTFAKSSADEIEQLGTSDLSNLFNEGISLITYFGHSSATTLEFNLDNPENYNNQGKYPVFIGLGCNAGNFFGANKVRFVSKETTSEKYILAPHKGTIGFVASTHFGIVQYLNLWNTLAYNRLANSSYGKPVGEILERAAQDIFGQQSQEDFFARATVEELTLHGDPAIKFNTHPKADYVIEDPMIKVSPGFISVADASFQIDAKILNIGKASSTSVIVEVKQQFPDGSTAVIGRDTLQGIQYMDSISLKVPIDPIHDKGLNKIIVTVDADNEVDEIFETNNSVTKDVMIYEDEARPVYPYNYAIINKPSVTLIASTANPFSPTKQYRMELDTTELFSSPSKIIRTVTSAGGTMEFDPGLTFKDSTVYYWRVAPVPPSGPFAWNTASFIYLPNSDLGFNQSHMFQHLKSSAKNIALDSTSGQWNFGTSTQNLFVRLGSWVTSTSQEVGVSLAVNADSYIRNSCFYQCLTFNVFDPYTFKPWHNVTSIPGSPVGGLYGSGYNTCFPGREYNFEFRWDSVSNRKRAMDFMQNTIPNGAYVVIRSFLLDPVAFPTFANMLKYANDWEADTAIHGSGQSLYHYLKNAGLTAIDSFYKPRQFALIYKKNDPSFTPRWVFSEGVYDNPALSVDCPTIDTVGFITSPKFGPAKAWKELRWNGKSLEMPDGDDPAINVLGYRADGQVDTLYRNLRLNQQILDISSVSAAQYPYLQVMMHNIDTVHYTPYQLNYWRFTYAPAPEGVVAPTLYFSMKDTVAVGQPLEFKIGFKNISEPPFQDSIKVKALVTDKNNLTHVLPVWKEKTLPAGDTLNVRYSIDTKQLAGINSMYVEVNPDNDQPEQYHFNNFFFKTFYVRPDTLNPLMDVTFDNIHILNRDIVSSRPDIMIKLKDEAKWFLLNDTSTIKVEVRFPDGSIKKYYFNGVDPMQFIPAEQAPSTNNTASVNMKPFFDQDGDYELTVTGKDMSQNKAGIMQYRVAFQVYNKPMISNMMNYPNPFTTSTAFVFTITGSEIPQNIRIQILTVTGKVVREITKDELGPLRIGRNITEFTWDGTDQYGQKLANGIYLYRVVTNLNGKSLDKFKADNDNTDKYFNKGYGKMYLMR